MIATAAKNNEGISDIAREGPNIKHVSETALWVAYYRAIESRRRDALFHDPYARGLAGERGEEIARTIPYSKNAAWSMTVRTMDFRMARIMRAAIPVDEEEKKFVSLGDKKWRENFKL